MTDASLAFKLINTKVGEKSTKTILQIQYNITIDW